MNDAAKHVVTNNGGHDFKRAGILRVGFEYQDLVAIEVLLKFLRDQNLYEWVQVEAEDSEFQAIDDVVACRKDGRLELTQVKFTPDPQGPGNKLSWEWLTGRKPKGTSLLQKWAKTALDHMTDGKLAQATLKTDREPNLEFSQCMDGSRVDYLRLTPKIKETVDNQIGPEEAVAFFEFFEFVHSQPRYDDFEESLRSELEYDIDKNGWAYFRQEVRRWAMRKNAPLPDGKIRHFNLLHVFAPDRPVALRQDFSVPPNYRVPDKSFHREFIDKARTADGVTVLWGPPGRGKSTYLSHCISKLAEQDNVVCIRHHYFLRLDEQGDRRFSYFAIERSLIQQMIDAGIKGIDQRNGLANALETAVSSMCSSGRRLVVVIDGLDHVWRDQKDLAQLELLFDSLLQLPEGVRLLVGTQKVDDEHLPKKLLRALPKERWTELPTMSVTAVCEWLRSQVAADRVHLEKNEYKTEEEIMDELGLALHNTSGGLPLHLVYSLKALVNFGEPLNVNAVRLLPECPSGEIEDYYESLWVRLSGGARRALHLLAGLRFSPPSFGLGKCLISDVIWWQVLEEIGHLLDCREASVVPFHGSLFAFLRDRPDHSQAFHSLAVNVLKWLEKESPEYWRRAWLWIMRSDLGDTTDLLNGPSREWAIDWFVSGYPVDQLVFILSQSESVALDVFDLPRLIYLRSLKTRALNARKFQTSDWGTFYETSLALSHDHNLGAVLRDNLSGLETEELPAVGSLSRGVFATAGRQVIKELERRRTSWSLSSDREIWNPYADAIIRMVARQPEDKADRVIAFAENFDAEGLIDLYMREALRVGNYGKVLKMGSRRSSYELDRNTFAALCLEGIGPNDELELASANRPAFGSLAILLIGKFNGPLVEADVSNLWQMKGDYNLGQAFQCAGHNVFFTSLTAALSGNMVGVRANLDEAENDSWLSRAIRALEKLASTIANEWQTGQRWPALRDVYRLFTIALPSQPTFREQRAITGLKLALRDISVDLCLLGTGVLGRPQIERHDVREVSGSSFWSMESWLDTFCVRPLPLHSKEGAEALLDLVKVDLEERVFEFYERAEITTKTARFALDHNSLERCRENLENAADCLLAYGYRKDVFVFEVLSSLRSLIDKGDYESRATLLSLAKEIEAITSYTDGDETSHARTELHKGITEYFPERVPALLAHLVSEQEWYQAERLITAWSEKIPAESETGRMLLATLISPGEFESAWEAANRMTEAQTSIRETLGRLTGRNDPSPDDENEIENPTSKQTQEIPDVSKFEPNQLVDFIRIAREDTSLMGTSAMSQWLAYWDVQGRYTEALDSFNDLLQIDGSRFDLAEALDTAFQISLNKQGRSKAYKWLVRAMVENKGWVRWWSSDEEFRERVRAVAQEYPRKWKDFVNKTSQIKQLGDAEDNWITVGHSRLVYFLAEVGELDLAKRCTSEMVEVFREEVSQQPLVTPDWAQ